MKTNTRAGVLLHKAAQLQGQKQGTLVDSKAVCVCVCIIQEINRHTQSCWFHLSADHALLKVLLQLKAKEVRLLFKQMFAIRCDKVIFLLYLKQVDVVYLCFEKEVVDGEHLVS